MLLWFGRAQEECHGVCFVAEDGGKNRQEKRNFGTFTRDLLRLADWLQQCGVTHVALESTGVYWKPVWNILEGMFKVLPVNAQHIKAVPVGGNAVQIMEGTVSL
jgi:transposase